LNPTKCISSVPSDISSRGIEPNPEEITVKSATPKWQYATKTVLMKDLMLTPGVLKQMCDTHNELYNFMKVCVLFDL